ncbi:MAG TPA: multidrug efflux RND transporter permease subunit [Stellaceae bacterium]|nr:multidrug efflux RND transporter permease subunit [Stellaceae bacterium]
MSISTPFIQRPIATSLLMLGILLVGIAAYPLLPVAPLPQVDFPTIQVTTQFAGASPETMASSVAQPLETQFAQIPGLAQMTSTSALGNTVISLQFDLNRNIDAAAGDVQAAINAASGQLPKTLPTPPTYRKVNPADSPILVLAVHSSTLPLTTVDNYAETIIAQQISQISGVAYVAIGGQQKPAVRIQVDPAKLASLGLSLEDVRSVILQATTDAPKGNLDGATHDFAVYDNDQLTTAKPWNDVIIAYRNGAPVRIRDVGRAVGGPQNRELAAWDGETPSIILIIFKQPGANVINTVDRIKAGLPQMTTAIPPAVKVDIASDRTTTIRASVADVEFTMMLTIALVVAVIFVFLRTLWATVIPGITVPLALVGTLGLMYVFGFSLDNLSLMGLTIAVGFVVDDAIVMLENIHRHIEEGRSPLDAAITGAGEIGFTIVSISLSLIAVFIPLLLMGGILGRLFREFAIVVSMTIVVSAVVSLTLTPMMCARFLNNEKAERHGRLYRLVESGFDLLLDGYRRGLDFVLQHQRLTLAVFFATVMATGYLFVTIPKGFFPQQDTGLITGFSEAAQDISFAEMVRRQHALTDVIVHDPDVFSVVSVVGAAAGSQTLNNGRVFITLKPRDQRSYSADQLIARWRPQLAKVQGAALFLQAAQDITIGARAARTQYQYTLQDSDLDELNAWAPKMLAKMKTLPQLTDVATDQQASAGTVTLTIDRDQAARFGIQPQLIDDTLYDAFGQRQVTQYFTQLSSYYVIEEVPPDMQGAPDTLNKIYLKSPTTGQEVPLSTFVKYTTRPITFLSINHQGQFPAVTLSFNLAPGTSLGQAVNAIQAAETKLSRPPTLIASFQGNAQAFQTSLASEPYLIAAALISVYIILGVLYESYIHPLTILSTLPSAGLGALLMLMLAHLDLSVIALVGVILLIGIVKKNGIMMLDFAIAAERDDGLSPLESIRRACLLRFRPIMMTTMAALLGGLPLMLGRGTGSEIRQPLGYAMVGGLLVSQALTLFTTPVIYLYLDRLNAWLNAASHNNVTSGVAMSALPGSSNVINADSEG